jgi:hypothetical protein
VIDVDDVLRAELDRVAPPAATADWDDVVARAGIRGARGRRHWPVAVAALAAAVTLGAATPLGSAIVDTVADFSAWLTGQPGSPVSRQEQREFEQANARSWLGFPEGTKLRRLITRREGPTTVDLLGFRSGSSTLCLRLVVTGATRGTTTSCAPLAELRRAGAPARVFIVDHGFGRGTDIAWYGIDRVRSSALRITAGIASDGVHSVVVEDSAGRHEVPATSNAFLYVAGKPTVERRVTRIWARTADALVPVPFAPAPFAFGSRPTAARPSPPAPDVERRVSDGRIGWLDSREPRGEALEVLPPRTRSAVLGRVGSGRRDDVLFGRVLAPDPDRPRRLVVTLNAHRAGGPPAGICTWLVTRGGAGGGGCSSYPGVFKRKPIVSGMSYHGPSEFVIVSGFASDDVDRVETLLAGGEMVPVPLKDNAFVIDLPRGHLPALLIAYDEDGRVIGVTRPFDDILHWAQPARGRAVELWRVRGPNGAHAELFVGPSTTGGECMFVKHFVDPRHTGVGVMCEPPRWRDGPLELGGGIPFVSGRVRADVKLVRMHFADGSSRTVRPRRGYVLVMSPSELVRAEGLGAGGSVVGRLSFPPRGG